MQVTKRLIPLAGSAIGTGRQLAVFRTGEGRPGPKIYLHAGLHADETPGMVILHHLIRLLEARSDEPCGEIIILPCANPIGLSQQFQEFHMGRFELGVGGNFNRNYPDVSAAVRTRLSSLRDAGQSIGDTEVRQALREAVADLSPVTELDSLKQILLGLAIDADYVLDMHCDFTSELYAFVRHLDHPATEALSRHLGLAVTILGSNGDFTFPGGCYMPWSAALDLLPDRHLTACFAATIEYRGKSDVSDDLALDDARRLIAFMESVGILDGEGGALPDGVIRHTLVDHVDYVPAPCHGVIFYLTAPGTQVQSGDLIAEILDPTTGERTSVRARNSGYLFAHSSDRIAIPGLIIAEIAGDTPMVNEPGEPYP